MKKLIPASAIILFFGLATFNLSNCLSQTYSYYSKDVFPGSTPINPPAINQDLRYEVHGMYKRPVKQLKLSNAKLISDVVPEYPVNWISDYVSVEISATYAGKVMKAVSSNDALNSEQKNILNTADIGTSIVVDVNYKYKNSVTEDIVNHVMHTWLTVVPEIEAEYPGGYNRMTKYFKENGINKISESGRKLFQQVLIRFSIDKKGEIVDSKIYETSGDAEIDKILIEAINKMPKWRPAQNSKGIKVKQEFEFNVGTNGGC